MDPIVADSEPPRAFHEVRIGEWALMKPGEKSPNKRLVVIRDIPKSKTDIDQFCEQFGMMVGTRHIDGRRLELIIIIEQMSLSCMSLVPHMINGISALTEAIQRNVQGTAIVFSNPALEFVINGILTAIPSKRERKCFNRQDENWQQKINAWFEGLAPIP